MNPQTSPSEVREFERYRCRINASVTVAQGNSEKITFSRHSGDGSGAVPGVIVDCSSGGFAIESGTFLPRASRARVTVNIPNQPPIELDVAVKRAVMINRKPVYNLGLSIVEPVADQETAIRRVLALAKASVGASAPHGAGVPAGGAPSA